MGVTLPSSPGGAGLDFFCSALVWLTICGEAENPESLKSNLLSNINHSTNRTVVNKRKSKHTPQGL